MKTKPKAARHPQWDEIEHSWRQEQWRFHQRLKDLGVDWTQTPFEDELAELRRHIESYSPASGFSTLSADEHEDLARWIETRVHDEVRRAIDACLRRVLM